MTDRNDSDSRTGPQTEGVRILGAEEARAALGERAPESEPIVDAEIVDDSLEVIETPEAAPGEPRTIVRFPNDGPTWTAGGETVDAAADPSAADPIAEAPSAEAPSDVADEEPTGEIPPLPHWTEPPTGTMPAIFADDPGEASSEDGEADAWAAISGSQPRFRAEGSDWAEADFSDEGLIDEAVKIGALAEATPVDEDEAFEEELEQRRRRTPRGRAPRTVVTTSPDTPRPPDTPRTPRPRPENENQPAPSTRDLPTALATAAVIVVVALFCFKGGTFWTALLCSVIVGLGTLELTGALQHRGFRPASVLALIASFCLPIAAREYGANAYPVFIAVLVLFSMLWFLWEVTPGRPLIGVATTVLAFGYVGGLGGFAGLILGAKDGVGLIIGTVACVVAYDVVGFFIGSQFGKSPVAPSISPNKTFEGTVAGMVAAVVVGWVIVGGLIGPGLHPWSPGSGAVLGLFVAAGAFLGDLCESMLKRDLGFKDFGSLLPGHGGVLDRFDALLFCLPITYYLALHLDLMQF